MICRAAASTVVENATLSWLLDTYTPSKARKWKLSSPVVFAASCREGLVWVDINWMDNGECLDLIEKVKESRAGHDKDCSCGAF